MDIWVYDPQPFTKFSKWDKNEILKTVQEEIAKSKRLAKIVKRISLKAGRIYFYHYYLVQKQEGVIYTLPFIDDKYFELVLARITIYKKDLSDCSVNWKRPNNEWITIIEGNIKECIAYIDEDEAYFYGEEG